MEVVMDNKQLYVDGYKALQSQWKKKDQELLLVGRLAYWIYWLSKLAEQATNPQEKNTFFQLKTNGILLLTKSSYAQIRKYVPEYHKRICYKHYEQMKKNGWNPHYFLKKKHEEITLCPKCKRSGVDHYFSLYSIAVLNEKEDIEGRIPLFVFYTPYLIGKEQFPPLDDLTSVKSYRGKETITIRPDERYVEVDTASFKKETIFRYYTKNYQALHHYLSQKDRT